MPQRMNGRRGMLRMRPLFVKFLTAVRLTRLTMAFGAVSDVWFVILFTQAQARAQGKYESIPVAQMSPFWALLAGAVVAIGLFAYGAALNDILDVRHDSAFSPHRPIPAGLIKLGQAIVVTVGALIIAVLVAGVWLGTLALWPTLLVAAGVLFYNAAGRYIPAVGVVTIGLIHGVHMLIPNAQLCFLLPVWLIMTHAMGIAAAVHLLEDKRPQMTRRGLAVLGVAWLFWSGVIIAIAVWRGGFWPSAKPLWVIGWPAAAVVGFILVARFKTANVSGPAAAEKVKRYGAMWQALYSAAWLMALGLTRQAAFIGVFAIAGFAAMTLIREITGLSGRPIAYR